MFQGCGRLRQGRDKEFLSSEKSKKVIGVFMETDYSPITFESSLDVRSYSSWPSLLASFGSFRNLEPWGRSQYWEIQYRVLILSEQMEGWDLLPALHHTECCLASFLKELGPSRALGFLLFMWTPVLSCSESLFCSQSLEQTFTLSCVEQLYDI